MNIERAELARKICREVLDDMYIAAATMYPQHRLRLCELLQPAATESPPRQTISSRGH